MAALEPGRPGPAYNVADDLPATWEEVFTAMAAAFGTPPPPRLPGWLLGLAAPDVASFVVGTSMRVGNDKARTELDWRPAFPTYRAGIDAMVSTPAESERSSHADEVPATADGDPGARTAFRRRRRRGAARVLRLGPAGRGVHRRPPPRDRAAVPLLPPWSERPFPFTFVFPVLKGGYFPGLYTAIGHLVLSACCSTCSCGSRRRRPHRHQPRPGECARSGVLRRYGDEPHRSDPNSAMGA